MCLSPVVTLDGILEGIFRKKVNFEKDKQTTKQHGKLSTQHAKSYFYLQALKDLLDELLPLVKSGTRIEQPAQAKSDTKSTPVRQAAPPPAPPRQAAPAPPRQTAPPRQSAQPRQATEVSVKTSVSSDIKTEPVAPTLKNEWLTGTNVGVTEKVEEIVYIGSNTGIF